MADIFRTLRQLSAGPTNLNRLGADDCKELESLGLVKLTESRHTNAEGERSTIARLTAEGRSKLYEIATAGATPSPVGREAQRQLPAGALLALAALRSGQPPSPVAAQVLVNAGLAIEEHGVCSLTRKGSDLLHSAASQDRLRSLRNPFKRG